MTAMSTEIQVGDVLRAGRYEVRELLRSACGKRVYLAHDRALDFPVVVDVFSNNLILPSGLSIGTWETRILGRLGGHPNIATVQDHWEDDGTAVMVLRYLVGGSLLDRIARSRDAGEQLPLDDIVRIAAEIARALEHIHGRGVLYRDLQPRNVLFDERGVVHLVDFDTAVLVADHDMSDLSDRPVIDYMAPELMLGERGDERADLYSLGATMYAMACGHPPFTGTREEILAGRRQSPPSALDRDDLPQELRDLMSQLLSPEPGHRPCSAAEVLGVLEGLARRRLGIERLLASDESATLEFKSTLRTPVGPARSSDKLNQKELERAIEHEVLDTMAAFLNSDGGKLVIGVADDKSIVGIERDYPRTSNCRDGWCRTFDNLVTRDLGTEVMNCVKLELVPWQGRTIAIVECERRAEPTWVGDDFYVRRMASTVKLPNRVLMSWHRERWG